MANCRLYYKDIGLKSAGVRNTFTMGECFQQLKTKINLVCNTNFSKFLYLCSVIQKLV